MARGSGRIRTQRGQRVPAVGPLVSSCSQRAFESLTHSSLRPGGSLHSCLSLPRLDGPIVLGIVDDLKWMCGFDCRAPGYLWRGEMWLVMRKRPTSASSAGAR